MPPMDLKTKRLSLRMSPQLYKRAEKMAAKKRWSVNFYIEEAIFAQLAVDEELAVIKK